MPLEIVQVPLLKDNYAYLLHEPKSGFVGIVDPSVADGPLKAARDQGWTITHILNTHHHWDHTGGNLEIKEATGAIVVGPAYDRERIPGIDIEVSEEAPFQFGEAEAEIIFIPGHTKGHIAFYFRDDKAAFVGDTLFAMGCGRMFEGTADQMFESLGKLKTLPGDTRIFCGHEYTRANGEFAMTVHPDNAAIKARMKSVYARRAEGLSTVPSLMSEELKTNPFLLAPDVKTFADVRARKDAF